MEPSPSSTRPSPALIGACGLVLGLGAGLALSQVLGRGVVDARGVSAQGSAAAAAPAGPAQPEAQETLAAPQESSLPAARVEASRAPEVSPSETTPEPEPEAPEVTAPPDLVAELSAFLRSGQIEGSLGPKPQQLVRFLAQQYMTHGRSHDALDLLRRHPSQDDNLYERVGRQLRREGSDDLAREAYLVSLELDPFDDDRLEVLRELDPGAALAVLDSKAAELGLISAGPLAMQRAGLLAALGRQEESRQAALDALGGDLVDETSWNLFAEIDPEAAETALRERVQGDPSGMAATRLAELIAKDPERKQEAVRLLEGVLVGAEVDDRAWNQLLALDAQRGLDLLASRDTSEVEPWVLSNAGDRLAELGRTSEAIDFWADSFTRSPSEGSAANGLLQHAPERLWAQSRESARTTRDDEVLGDLADLHWEHGRREEALELYRRANSIDPDDGEWTRKLRRAALGGDPR